MYDLDQMLGQRPPRRKRNGCYAKGCTPYSKGKKWDEYLTPEQQAKIVEALTIANRRPHPWAHGVKKPVIAINEDGRELWFESGAQAARCLGVDFRIVNHIVHGQRKTTGGWRFKRAMQVQH